MLSYVVFLYFVICFCLPCFICCVCSFVLALFFICSLYLYFFMSFFLYVFPYFCVFFCLVLALFYCLLFVFYVFICCMSFFICISVSVSYVSYFICFILSFLFIRLAVLIDFVCLCCVCVACVRPLLPCASSLFPELGPYMSFLLSCIYVCLSLLPSSAPSFPSFVFVFIDCVLYWFLYFCVLYLFVLLPFLQFLSSVVLTLCCLPCDVDVWHYFVLLSFFIPVSVLRLVFISCVIYDFLSCFLALSMSFFYLRYFCLFLMYFGLYVFICCFISFFLDVFIDYFLLNFLCLYFVICCIAVFLYLCMYCPFFLSVCMYLLVLSVFLTLLSVFMFCCVLFRCSCFVCVHVFLYECVSWYVVSCMC